MKRLSKLTKEQKEETNVNAYEMVVPEIPKINIANEIYKNDTTEKENEENFHTVNEEPITIALIDENYYSRSALKNIIQDTDYNIIIEEGYGTKMKDLLMTCHEDDFPELIIVGGDSEFDQSYDNIKWIKDNFYETNIIYLSDTNNNEHIVKILKLGITSVIFRKKYSPEEVLKEISKIVREDRKYVFDDYTIKIILDALSINKNIEKTAELPKTLTSRDIEIIKSLIEGKTSNDIAITLDLSVRTIEGIINAILVKFSTKSRTNLVARAIKAGILDI